MLRYVLRCDSAKKRKGNAKPTWLLPHVWCVCKRGRWLSSIHTHVHMERERATKTSRGSVCRAGGNGRSLLPVLAPLLSACASSFRPFFHPQTASLFFFFSSQPPVPVFVVCWRMKKWRPFHLLLLFQNETKLTFHFFCLFSFSTKLFTFGAVVLLRQR